MWTHHQQPQQRGAQLHARGPQRRPGETPDEATRDRAAQQHDQAGDQTLQPGGYPASPIEHADRDNTPTVPEAQVAWDEVVQPERRREHDRDDQPLPESP